MRWLIVMILSLALSERSRASEDKLQSLTSRHDKIQSAIGRLRPYSHRPTEASTQLGQEADALLDETLNALNEVSREMETSTKQLLSTLRYPREAKPFAEGGEESNPSLVLILKGFILSHHPSPVLIRLRLHATYLKYLSLTFTFFDALAVSEGQRKLSYRVFQEIRSEVDEALASIRESFPSFPELRFGRDVIEENGTWRKERLLDFESFFLPLGERELSPIVRESLSESLLFIQTSVRRMEKFERDFFPSFSRDEILKHLQEAVFSQPGAKECFLLARGYSDFEGPPCRWWLAKSSLRRYVDYYEKSLKEANSTPFDGDYTENLLAARELFRELDQKFVEGESFDRPLYVSRLSSTTTCKPFLDWDKSYRAWVIKSLGPEPEFVRGSASSTLLRRTVWLHKVKMGSAVTLQPVVVSPKQDIFPRDLLAGMALRTSLSLLVQNAAQLKLLLGDSIGSSPADLGIKGESSAAADRYVRSSTTYLSYSEIIDAVRDQYEETLGAFGMEELKGEKRSEWGDKFRRKYRNEMNEAARKIQDFKVRLENPTFDESKTSRDTEQRWKETVAQRNMDQSVLIFREEVAKDIEKRTGREAPAIGLTELSEQLELSRSNKKLQKRYRQYLGDETYDLLLNQPIVRARLVQHAETVESNRSLIEHLISFQFYHFPALKMDDSWKTYSDSQFDSVMRRFLYKIVGEANVLQSLKSTKAILDRVVPNPILMDHVLKLHPDQKRALCDEQVSRDLWDRQLDSALLTVSIGSTALLFVPVLAPVGAAVSLGAAGVALVADGVRAYRKAQHLENARTYAMSTLAQTEFEEGELRNPYYFRELEARYHSALFLVGGQAALSAIPVVGRASGLRNLQREALPEVKRLFKQWTKKRLVAVSRSFGEGAKEYFRHAPARLATLWKERSRRRLLVPIEMAGERLGLIRRWPHLTFRQRLNAGQWLPRAALGVAKDRLLEFPLSPFNFAMGEVFGSGFPAKALTGYGAYWLIQDGLHRVNVHRELSIQLVLERVRKNAEEGDTEYLDWLSLVDSGDLTQLELYQTIRHNERLNKMRDEALLNKMKEPFGERVEILGRERDALEAEIHNRLKGGLEKDPVTLSLKKAHLELEELIQMELLR